MLNVSRQYRSAVSSLRRRRRSRLKPALAGWQIGKTIQGSDEEGEPLQYPPAGRSGRQFRAPTKKENHSSIRRLANREGDSGLRRRRKTTPVSAGWQIGKAIRGSGRRGSPAQALSLLSQKCSKVRITFYSVMIMSLRPSETQLII